MVLGKEEMGSARRSVERGCAGPQEGQSEPGTPGPWFAYPSSNDPSGKPHYWYVTTGDGPFEPAVACTWPSSISPEADARLLAAAPELLSALKACLKGMSDFSVHGPCVVQARSAIAKAEGK